MKIHFSSLQFLNAVILFLAFAFSSVAGVAFAQDNMLDVAAPTTPLTRAQAAIDKRDWTGAETLLYPLAKSDDKNPFIYYALAQVYENTHRVEAAKNIYQAIAAIPESERTKYVLITETANKKSMTLLSTAAQEKLQQFSSTSPVAATPAKVTEATSLSAAPAKIATDDAPQMTALNHWQQAWIHKDAPQYLASYVKGFKGDKSNATEWAQFRKTKIEGKSKIDVKITDVQTKALDINNVQLSFTQAYTSNSFTDVTKKTLVMTNVDGRWLISKETSK